LWWSPNYQAIYSDWYNIIKSYKFLEKIYHGFSAASCLYTQEGLKSADNILVYLGKTRLDDEWAIDKDVQLKSVIISVCRTFNLLIGTYNKLDALNN
jgi:hypothetical protein